MLCHFPIRKWYKIWYKVGRATKKFGKNWLKIGRKNADKWL
jgi:hypothetical protein